LARTVAPGGGARSVTTIANEIFRRPYCDLSDKQKKAVDDRQRSEHTWHNYHQAGQVRAVECSEAASGMRGGIVQPCFREVLYSKPFKNALNNLKHVNCRFRNDLVGEQCLRVRGLEELINEDVSSSIFISDNVFVRFVKGVLAGKYSDYNVFLGLVDAMVKRVEREERGKGMQNFQYTSAWDEFIHIVRIHSPRAHQFMSKHFPARSGDSIRYVVFSCGISLTRL
ncbi:hypothetical protein GGX14DRAFT_370365, partial [Mycena pura]